jgi:hypothetical protein
MLTIQLPYISISLDDLPALDPIIYGLLFTTLGIFVFFIQKIKRQNSAQKMTNQIYENDISLSIGEIAERWSEIQGVKKEITIEKLLSLVWHGFFRNYLIYENSPQYSRNEVLVTFEILTPFLYNNRVPNKPSITHTKKNNLLMWGKSIPWKTLARLKYSQYHENNYAFIKAFKEFEISKNHFRKTVASSSVNLA